MLNCIRGVSQLGTPPFATLDPFLFAVYHKDNYPAGNAKMEAPRMGNGADFDHSAPYRMYRKCLRVSLCICIYNFILCVFIHVCVYSASLTRTNPHPTDGERVPGFPSHPHRGFETLTATIEGLVDHADSTGCAGRYGQGDNQWMTAGKGIQHSEMFPLINQTSPNPLRFFQIWLNLPGAKKMVDPFFVMHWAEEVPKFVSLDGLTSGTIFAGELEGKKGLAPPPNSWAATKENEVAVWHITLKPGAQFALPVAKGGQDINRQVYFIEGKALTVGDQAMNEHVIVNLNAGITAELHNHGSDTSEVLVLQGKPIGQPVVQHGPFVMNTDAEIRQAFSDYQQTQFGGAYKINDSTCCLVCVCVCVCVCLCSVAFACC